MEKYIWINIDVDFNSMKNHGITRIASFDSVFDKIKGFERVH